MFEFTRNFSEVGIGDIARVGGKNASPGEMWTELAPPFQSHLT
jgi:phosphoenolpyruvate synthase/pyruvate phosphate dikinase